MATWYHCTPRGNLVSIRHTGLRTEYATGARKAVWLHSAAQRVWALAHCSARHRVPVSDLVVIQLRTKGPLVRHGGARKGIRYSRQDIPPAEVVGWMEGAVLCPSVEE